VATSSKARPGTLGRAWVLVWVAVGFSESLSKR
jgi:hypothetical protein